jgi:hypothetical protein
LITIRDGCRGYRQNLVIARLSDIFGRGRATHRRSAWARLRGDRGRGGPVRYPKLTSRSTMTVAGYRTTA